MKTQRYPAILLFTAFFALPAFFTAPAGAQDSGFAQNIEDGYDIHARRIDYYGDYIEHRRALDERRHRYQAPRQEMIDGYRAQWKNEDRTIDYSAGMAGQDSKRQNAR